MRVWDISGFVAGAPPLAYSVCASVHACAGVAQLSALALLFPGLPSTPLLLCVQIVEQRRRKDSGETLLPPPPMADKAAKDAAAEAGLL